MPRRKPEVPARAARGSVVKLNGLTVSEAAAARVDALAVAMRAAGMGRPKRSGALELLIMEPERARKVLGGSGVPADPHAQAWDVAPQGTCLT